MIKSDVRRVLMVQV